MFYKSARKLFVFASLSMLAVILSSCGMWRNFTTYFNTYYNAKTLFDRTEEAILSQRKDIFAFREDVTNSSNRLGGSLGSQNTNQFSGNVNQNSFQNQNNPQFNNQNNQFNNQNNQFNNQNNSQFANQQSNQSSFSSQQGKSSLGSGQFGPDLTKVVEKCSKILQYDKESAYFTDALFIIGKAFYYQQEYASAQRKFLELAGLGKTKYSLVNNLWLAKTYLQLRSFDEGLKLIEDVKAEALKEDDKDVYKDACITKISFYVFREDYRDAIEECKSLLNVSIDDETSALVSYEMGKIYLEMKDNSNALDAFAGVQKYSPTFEVEYESRMEHAKLLKALNKIDESEAELNTLRSMGKFRNYLDEILVELGNIYYDKNEIKPAIELFREVDSTYKAKPTAGLADHKLGEIYEKKYRDYDSSYKYYIKSVSLLQDKDLRNQTNDKVKNIDRYRQYKTTINKDLEDLGYVENPGKFDRDSVDYDVAYRQYLDENKKLIEQQQQANSGQGGLRNQQDQFGGQQQFQQQPVNPRVKKKDEKDMTVSELIAAGKLKKPVRPKISADSIKSILSEDYYGLGSLFFSELEVPDSAYFYFHKILSDFASKPVAVKTMFAMGTYYETRNDTTKADSLFKYIYDNYPKDPLRKAVVEKIGLDKKEGTQTVEQETDDPAKKIYLQGEKLYYDKKYKEALDVFNGIYNNYPKSDYAPKSIYYVGMIYENNLLNNDSAAVAYGKLINDFKKSPLLALVTDKYNNYEAEQKRLMEEKDKKEIKSTQPVSKDSTGTENKQANGSGVKTDQGNTAQPSVQNLKKDSVNTAKAQEKSEIKNAQKSTASPVNDKKELTGHENANDEKSNRALNHPAAEADSVKKAFEARRKIILDEDKKPAAPPDTVQTKKEIPK